MSCESAPSENTRRGRGVRSTCVTRRKWFGIVLTSTILALICFPASVRAQTGSAGGTTDKYSDCDNSTYYSPILDSQTKNITTSRADLANHIRSTHRDQLPYTSSSEPDVWDALIDLDRGTTASDTVRLVYTAVDVPAEPKGTSDTWNREHLWPRSRGVDESGPDNTDMHHIRPANASTNTARGALSFGTCGAVEPVDECRVPGHVTAASDTARDGTVWLPPADVRGNIARSMFYMALRYDGSEKYTSNLTLSDCPEKSSSSSEVHTVMGYLTSLLQWHLDDPVDDAERIRNGGVCARYQGNRNPYVDYPHLVSMHFGKPHQPIPTDGQGFPVCTNPSGSGGSSVGSGDDSSSTTTAPEAACDAVRTGDVVITGYHSKDTDVVLLVPTVDLPSGMTLYMTDNAWTGTQFRTNEGTQSLSLPNPVDAGTIISYGGQESRYATAFDALWETDRGSFALSTKGDSILVYCRGNGGQIVHLYGVIYSSGGWMPPSTDETTFGSDGSALPTDLEGIGNVELSQGENQWYEGIREGDRIDILESLAKASQWNGGSGMTMDPLVVMKPFAVTSITSASTNGLTSAASFPWGRDRKGSQFFMLRCVASMGVGLSFVIL